MRYVLLYIGFVDQTEWLQCRARYDVLKKRKGKGKAVDPDGDSDGGSQPKPRRRNRKAANEGPAIASPVDAPVPPKPRPKPRRTTKAKGKAKETGSETFEDRHEDFEEPDQDQPNKKRKVSEPTGQTEAEGEPAAEEAPTSDETRRKRGRPSKTPIANAPARPTPRKRVRPPKAQEGKQAVEVDTPGPTRRQPSRAARAARSVAQ